MTTATDAKITYTDSQALDEALLLFTRKLRRLHYAAYAEVIAMLPDGARDALALADIRADVTRVTIPAGTAEWPDAYGWTE